MMKPSLVAPLVALFLWGCLMEDRFIFYPDSKVEITPQQVGLPFEDVFFSTSDGVRLNGWFVPAAGSTITMLWSHGNAGNISHRVENMKLLREKVGWNIFIYDYRGYGRSEGRISEQGTYRDAEAALRYLRSRSDIDAKKIVLFGRSLGAAVATDLATSEPCLALILETPFASIPEMARIAFPFVPIGPFLKTRYDVLDKVRRIKVPLLVLHGDQDEVVPFSQGRRVFEAAPEPKQFYVIPGAHHNDTYILGGSAYFAALKNFIEQAAAGELSSGQLKPQ